MIRIALMSIVMNFDVGMMIEGVNWKLMIFLHMIELKMRLTRQRQVGELNASNSFSTIIEFEKNSPNYILFIEGTSYSDTISDITFEREGCNDEIENFEYKHNGDLRKDNELTIN